MLPIKESHIMSASPVLENRIIRIPEVLRVAHKLELGEYIVIKNKALQVREALVQDTQNSIENAYVTKKLFSELGTKHNGFQVVNRITMGCDPEFFLKNLINGAVISPSRFFEKNGRVGYDGLAVEIRPEPHIQPSVVVNNMYTLLQQVKNVLTQHKVFDVGMFAQSHARIMGGQLVFAGFHIHIGIPSMLLNPKNMFYKGVQQMIIRALDYYVSPLATIAEGTDSYRRTGLYTPYGKLSDYRVHRNTLEYRVPGGALLKHPKLAQGLISMCSMVTNDLLERVRIYTNNFTTALSDPYKTLCTIYPDTTFDINGLLKLIATNDLTHACDESLKILDDFKYMINYNLYEKSIKDFMYYTHMDISNNISVNWSLQ